MIIPFTKLALADPRRPQLDQNGYWTCSTCRIGFHLSKGAHYRNGTPEAKGRPEGPYCWECAVKGIFRDARLV